MQLFAYHWPVNVVRHNLFVVDGEEREEQEEEEVENGYKQEEQKVLLINNIY